MKGIYVLVLWLNNDLEVTIGKLGKFHFKTGYYYYVGSAHGTGGFKRVTRHFNVASGKNSTRKWHIDYLLPHSEVICALLFPTDGTLECKVAGIMEKFSEIISCFGCSDCRCETHLFLSDVNINNNIIRTVTRLTGNESIIIYPSM